ncbi:Hsp20/alpha crystallin family protein [Spirosoma koreense]
MFRNHHAGYGPDHHQHRASFYEKFWRGAGPFRRPKYNVPVNIVDKGETVEIHVYALGFEKENITVSVADGLLHISGTRSLTEEPQFVRQEYPVKSFERVVQLNDRIDVSAVSARQENGVLIVTLPKRPEANRPEQTIEIA